MFCDFVLYFHLFISTVNGFLIFGNKHGLNYLLEDFNITFGTFDKASVEQKWIEQSLDHFNEQDNRTWNMRYLQRLDTWKTDGPIFVFIGGEWEISEGFLNQGTMSELAQETNGAMYYSEHRYYGKSLPFEQFSTENLYYLSSRQALADLAHLLTNIKSNSQFKESKVVVFGGSYSANLAAWLKLLYPNLVDVAVASSGPVEAKADFYEYLETVSDDYEQYGSPGCYEKIKSIFTDYDTKFKTAAGIEELKKEENICEYTDMTKIENKQLFFMHKINRFMGTAQYGDVGWIKKHCKELNESSRVFSPRDEDVLLIWNVKQECLDYDFNEMIDYFKNSNSFYKAWIYQTCTEFGYYQTTSSKNHPFTNNVPLDFSLKMCSEIYGKGFHGERVEDGVRNANKMYGGLKPNVTNVVFVNGELDPWHRLSVLEDISYGAPAKVVPFSSHCRDLAPDRETDPEELKEARRYVKYLVKKWIGAGEFVNIQS